MTGANDRFIVKAPALRCAMIAVLATWLSCNYAYAEAPTDSYARLQKLSRLAPARQVGQEGNRLAGQWIHDRFADLTRRQNDQWHDDSRK